MIKNFEKVLIYLNHKQWLLKENYKETIKELKEVAKTSKDMDLKRSVKNYTKYFEEPLYFEHDLTTYKTGRVYAQYVLFPNKAINGIYLKDLIIPKPNYVFVSFDFKTSQIRHIVVKRNLKILKEFIDNGKDLYEEFAKILKITRNQAKLSMLLLNYGGDIKTLQKEFKKELDDEKILEIYNLFKDWFNTEGYTYEDKVKLNHQIQKDEVDFFKRKMITLFKKQNEKWNLHAFIHDDIILEVHENHLNEIPKIKKFLEKYTPIKMEVEVKISKTFQFERR